MAQIVLQLKNLNCPHCAQKIEHQVANLAEVDHASLDFVSKKLKIDLTDETQLVQSQKKITQIVHGLEPDVEVHLQEKNSPSSLVQNPEEDIQQRKYLLKIFAGLALLIGAACYPQDDLIKTAIYLTSYLVIGGDILLRAVRNIARGQVFDENFLMALATVGAICIGEFAEGVSVMLFYQVGEFFQSYAVNRSRKSIIALMDIKADFANVLRDGQLITVNPEDVSIGERIVIKPGERFPLDGIVKEGATTVDTSALTGESLPRDISLGDSVLSGCINKTGVVTVEVTCPFKDSTVMKILEMVENASEKKAKTENFITKFARYYTPVVVAIAACLAFLPPLIITGASFSEWVYRGLVFLVISCPCALVISVPMSFFAGIGVSSRQGILIKGSNYLEVLSKTSIAVFDKTGTLTKGNFTVQTIVPASCGAEDLLEYAAFAQCFSNHPISLAIQKAYGKEVDVSRIQNATEMAGLGVCAWLGEDRLLAGNARLLEQEGIVFTKSQDPYTAVYVAKNNDYLGYLTIADTIKEDTAAALRGLKKRGIEKTIMLTGDKESVALEVARKTGIDDIYAGLLPQNKVEKIEQLLAQKPKDAVLLFAGDGINDAPSLTRSDIGVAMGILGSDAAAEAADIVIMTDELSKLPLAIDIARKTMAIVKQNIVFVLAIKILVLSLGAAGFASMWAAVFADVGVSVLAILNAMRIFLVQKNPV